MVHIALPITGPSRWAQPLQQKHSLLQLPLLAESPAAARGLPYFYHFVSLLVMLKFRTKRKTNW